MTLVLTNTGAAACTLQGWPGVSFVGHGNGTQLGAAATQNRSGSLPHATVVLARGGSARSSLKIVDAGNYPAADCKATGADGLRVYPPGSTTALFIAAHGLQACAVATHSLLTVAALR